MKYLSILAICLALCGCVTDASGPRGWQKSELIGYSLRLISASGAIEEFSFTDAGDAISTLGSTEMVTGPVLSWEIRNDGALRLFDDGNRTFATLKIVRTRGEHYTVQEDGIVREFILQKWPEYYGWHTQTK